MLLLVQMNAFSQPNMVLVNPPSTVTGISSDNLLSAHFDVINSGADTLDVYVTQTTLQPVIGGENSFCWLQCYTSSTTISPDPVTIAPGATITWFVADYWPNGTVGENIVKYQFYELNATDTAETTIRFITTQSNVGTDEYNNHEPVFLGPNPADSKIEFSTDQTFKLYNSEGELVLEGKSKTIQTNYLPTGNYFLEFDEGRLKRKIIIAH